MTETTMPGTPSSIQANFSDDDLAIHSLQDAEAFATLYSRYVRRVYNYLYGKVGQAADAEDLTSQVFAEVVESLNRYHPQGTFAAWIFTIARRRAANWLRSRRVGLPLDVIETPEHALPDPLKQVLDNEQAASLRRQIQKLNPEEIELLRLHFSAGLTYREMSRVLGKSESAVGVSMHRLLRRLEADCEAVNG